MSGGNSSWRKRILEIYSLHPIRDRAYIRRWLPKLYAAISRREGWPWVYQAMGGWVPAMLITEHGVPDGFEPYNPANLIHIILRGTSRKDSLLESPIVQRRQRITERRSG